MNSCVVKLMIVGRLGLGEITTLTTDNFVDSELRFIQAIVLVSSLKQISSSLQIVQVL